MDELTRQISDLMRGERLTLATFRTTPGGATSCEAQVGLGPAATRAEYCHGADAWQAEFDADGDPVRVYVLDADGVPVYAACALARHRHRRGGGR